MKTFLVAFSWVAFSSFSPHYVAYNKLMRLVFQSCITVASNHNFPLWCGRINAHSDVSSQILWGIFSHFVFSLQIHTALYTSCIYGLNANRIRDERRKIFAMKSLYSICVRNTDDFSIFVRWQFVRRNSSKKKWTNRSLENRIVLISGNTFLTPHFPFPLGAITDYY